LPCSEKPATNLYRELNPSKSEALGKISLRSCFSRWRVISPTPNPPPSRRTTPYRLSATYQIYSQLFSVSEGRPLHPQPENLNAVVTGTYVTDLIKFGVSQN